VAIATDTVTTAPATTTAAATTTYQEPEQHEGFNWGLLGLLGLLGLFGLVGRGRTDVVRTTTTTTRP
jgi:hypothetical protein